MAEPAVAEAAALLGRARRVVVFTGAGMSAESGVPTFRDALTGLWRRYDPQALATPEAFHADPALVWGPAAEVPQVAARCGGTVIQINPQPTPLDAVAQVNLRGPAAQLLPALVRAAWDA